MLVWLFQDGLKDCFTCVLQFNTATLREGSGPLHLVCVCKMEEGFISCGLHKELWILIIWAKHFKCPSRRSGILSRNLNKIPLVFKCVVKICGSEDEQALSIFVKPGCYFFALYGCCCLTSQTQAWMSSALIFLIKGISILDKIPQYMKCHFSLLNLA